MVILDTDHMTLLEWQDNPAARALEARLDALPLDDITTTGVNFEEQCRGWLTALSKTRKVTDEIEKYRRLNRMLWVYGGLRVLDFDERAAVEFQSLRKQHRRIGSLDLRIAAIAVATDSLLLTRNLRDFRQIPNLRVDDWTKQVSE